jgi:hypothetical protein
MVRELVDVRHQFEDEYVTDASATTATLGLTAPLGRGGGRDGRGGAGDRLREDPVLPALRKRTPSSSPLARSG